MSFRNDGKKNNTQAWANESTHNKKFVFFFNRDIHEAKTAVERMK
jgi:hypothetical protein